MSKEIASRTHIIATELGNMVVSEKLVIEHDVEDIVRDRALSLGRHMQMVNLSKELDSNTQWPEGVAPTSFKSKE